MLVLEATSERQGDRDDDYHWCTDGELAYCQGVECANPDCGCDRGWAGFDSHRATTTVRVVDRPDFTVADLAGELATSMSDGGWIDTADPADPIVAAFVEEIIECANHFGEGAVLERRGGLITTRHDPEADRQMVIEITEDLEEAGPIALLNRAAHCIAAVGPEVDELCRSLVITGWHEASLLDTAIRWLSTVEVPESLLDPDTPRWLHELGRGVISAARRRKEGDSTSYLVELEVGGDLLGTMQLRLDDSGRLYNAFVASDDVDGLARLLTTLENRRLSSGASYRRILPRTAVRELRRGRAAYDADPTPDSLANPWPRNRALIDFVLDRFDATRG